MDPQTVGSILRRYREQAGYPLRHVATTLGLSAPYVADMERGQRLPPPSVDLLDQWMGVVNVPSEQRIAVTWQALIEREPGYREVVRGLITAGAQLAARRVQERNSTPDAVFEDLLAEATEAGHA